MWSLLWKKGRPTRWVLSQLAAVRMRCAGLSGGARTTPPAKLLTDNLHGNIFPDTSTFEDKATQWFHDLLLNKNDDLDDKIGFDNGILVAYGMCPPCELLVPRHKLSLIRSSSNKPTISCDAHQTKYGNLRMPDGSFIVFYVIFFS
jgi:hypothetical protein